MCPPCRFPSGGTCAKQQPNTAEVAKQVGCDSGDRLVISTLGCLCTLLSKQPFLTGKRDRVCMLHSVPMIQFFMPVFSPAEDLCLIPLLTRTGAWQKVSPCSAQALVTAAVRLLAAGPARAPAGLTATTAPSPQHHGAAGKHQHHHTAHCAWGRPTAWGSQRSPARPDISWTPG